MTGARKAWLIAGVVALTVLSSLPWIDTRAEADYQALFQRALVTFALARTLNGAISAVQGTEVALQPAGVGLTLTPGEVLDPVNDLVERFSWIMLGATVSLGIQNVLLDVSGWWGMRLVVALLGLAWLVARIRAAGEPGFTSQLLLRAFLVALFVRLAVPLTLVANDLLYDAFLEPRYERSTAVIESAGAELEALGERTVEGEAETDPGFLDGLVGRVVGEDGWRARLDRMQERAGAVIEHLIELAVVFILQTGILPIAFLWLLLQGVKRAFVFARPP